VTAPQPTLTHPGAARSSADSGSRPVGPAGTRPGDRTVAPRRSGGSDEMAPVGGGNKPLEDTGAGQRPGSSGERPVGRRPGPTGTADTRPGRPTEIVGDRPGGTDEPTPATTGTARADLRPPTKPTPATEPGGSPAQTTGPTPPRIDAPKATTTREHGSTPNRDTGATSPNSASPKAQILRNKEVGDAASARIAARYPGADREVTLYPRSGPRRVDVLTPDGQAIESKVGRTSLTPRVRQELSRDEEILKDSKIDAVTSVRWEFSRSPTTGKIGPTGPLAKALEKAGIPWRLR
jgi:hypothetical protein